MVGSPDIVDALPMSEPLYIQGKKVGTTNVSIFDQSMRMIGVIDIEVALDTRNLQDRIVRAPAAAASREPRQGQIVLAASQATQWLPTEQ